MKTRTWLACWGLLVAVALLYLGRTLRAEDRSLFVPGPSTSGHHTIEAQCDACHTPFRGAEQAKCLRCHGERLSEENDSHAASKFDDPRNADRLAAMDVRRCVTCHREHTPDGTGPIGVTVPRDFCSRCHKDIGQDRADHQGFAFDRCADAGCHNYHDNRALNADFMTKHLHESDVLASREVPALAHAPTASAPAPDAPGPLDETGSARDWAHSAHARASVNCSQCHQPAGAGWSNAVQQEACRGCHAEETRGFLSGVHGLRASLGLSPLTPEMARLPMRGSASHVELGCNACHRAHAYDSKQAAVEACLLCHDDRHSVAYARSPHAALWNAELAGQLPPGSGVSCATCHMPRVSVQAGEGTSVRKVVVQHDQSANLEPVIKQARDVCLHCHGLGFTLDALADPELVSRNFGGAPRGHVPSLSMVEQSK